LGRTAGPKLEEDFISRSWERHGQFDNVRQDGRCLNIGPGREGLSKTAPIYIYLIHTDVNKD
jgi:hypothetical protein